ncbi:enoyl-CoA hydratase/isomerase family protein [Peribacillus cavernae]|uniref:enoyl-CoA hydratase/isomerase family protein n=1 Tax=Peribacillus cavernae TaxID=1674310 RepID=UPI001FECABE7|nr:enoyl-CoA hydratase-related protein [Peribacillus cavernae]MDQ0216940.1 enoyl-CoA hydratase/carnithine racemase [Peribacillus cavernae]
MTLTDEKKVYLDVKDGVGTIYINRPEKRNALTYEMWVDLARLVDECNENSEIKVIVFRSTTDVAFSAGADIGEFKTIRYTAEGAAKYNDATMVLEEKIAKSPKPSIAMISGFCVGGGCEIAVACDFRFSDNSGRFGITPAKLGLIYNTPGTKNLVDLVGPAHAKDILFTGRIMEAEEAFQMGLINRIIDKTQLEAETYQFAKLICQNAQMAVRGSKTIINRVLEGDVKDSEKTAELVLESFESDDYREGVSAFLEKRKPNFTFS